MNYNKQVNLQEIKRNYKKRLINTSSINLKSMENELKEWIEDSFDGNEFVWTLPDLTKTERLDNFCRSIKKKVY